MGPGLRRGPLSIEAGGSAYPAKDVALLREVVARGKGNQAGPGASPGTKVV